MSENKQSDQITQVKTVIWRKEMNPKEKQAANSAVIPTVEDILATVGMSITREDAAADKQTVHVAQMLREGHFVSRLQSMTKDGPDTQSIEWYSNNGENGVAGVVFLDMSHGSTLHVFPLKPDGRVKSTRTPKQDWLESENDLNGWAVGSTYVVSGYLQAPFEDVSKEGRIELRSFQAVLEGFQIFLEFHPTETVVKQGYDDTDTTVVSRVRAYRVDLLFASICGVTARTVAHWELKQKGEAVTNACQYGFAQSPQAWNIETNWQLYQKFVQECVEVAPNINSTLDAGLRNKTRFMVAYAFGDWKMEAIESIKDELVPWLADKSSWIDCEIALVLDLLFVNADTYAHATNRKGPLSALEDVSRDGDEDPVLLPRMFASYANWKKTYYATTVAENRTSFGEIAKAMKVAAKRPRGTGTGTERSLEQERQKAEKPAVKRAAGLKAKKKAEEEAREEEDDEEEDDGDEDNDDDDDKKKLCKQVQGWKLEGIAIDKALTQNCKRVLGSGNDMEAVHHEVFQVFLDHLIENDYKVTHKPCMLRNHLQNVAHQLRSLVKFTPEMEQSYETLGVLSNLDVSARPKAASTVAAMAAGPPVLQAASVASGLLTKKPKKILRKSGKSKKLERQPQEENGEEAEELEQDNVYGEDPELVRSRWLKRPGTRGGNDEGGRTSKKPRNGKKQEEEGEGGEEEDDEVDEGVLPYPQPGPGWKQRRHTVHLEPDRRIPLAGDVLEAVLDDRKITEDWANTLFNNTNAIVKDLREVKTALTRTAVPAPDPSELAVPGTADTTSTMEGLVDRFEAAAAQMTAMNQAAQAAEASQAQLVEMKGALFKEQHRVQTLLNCLSICAREPGQLREMVNYLHPFMKEAGPFAPAEIETAINNCRLVGKGERTKIVQEMKEDV